MFVPIDWSPMLELQQVIRSLSRRINSQVCVMRSDHLRLHVGVFITFISRPRSRADSRQLPLLFLPLKTNVKYRGFSGKARPSRLPPAPTRQLDKCTTAARLARTGGVESRRDVRPRRDGDRRILIIASPRE